MTANNDKTGKRRGGWWRIPMWATLGGLLLVPLVAMQFTAEVDWGPEDFAIMGVLLAIVGGGVELGARLSGNVAYRAAVALAMVAGFLLIWMNLAVGIIGDEDNPLNQMYAGVLMVGVAGAFIANFKAGGLARVLIAMAVAQVVVAGVAQAAGHFTWILTAGFVSIWSMSSWLFARAAREEAAREEAAKG